MLHHLSIAVTDLVASGVFYDAALAALGYRRVAEAPRFVGYGVEDGKDRFALKLVLDYPEPADELAILERMATTGPPKEVRRVVECEAILAARQAVDAVGLDARLAEHIVRLITATRRPAEAGLPELEPLIQYGASPRGTITLALCSRAEALLEGRDYVTPRDIKRVAHDVLRHRVAPTFEAEAEGRDSDAILGRILEHVPAP